MGGVQRVGTSVPVARGPHPAFNAALYTLDVLIPAPALGQASDFDPQGATLVMAAGLHILGWLLAITVIAAITRSFSKTDFRSTTVSVCPAPPQLEMSQSIPCIKGFAQPQAHSIAQEAHCP